MLNRNEIEELIGRIERAESWDAIEASEYIKLCESLGLNFKDYDDPDRLFEAIKVAAKKLS